MRLVFVLIALACVVPAAAAARDLAVERLWSGEGDTLPSYDVLTDAKAFQTWWDDHSEDEMPNVDLDDRFVVVASGGFRTSQCGFGIVSASDEDAAVVVRVYGALTTDPAGACSQVLGAPGAAASVERVAGPVVFVDHLTGAPVGARQVPG